MASGDHANATSDEELYVDMENPKTLDVRAIDLPNLKVLWAGPRGLHQHGLRFHAQCGPNYVRP